MLFQHVAIAGLAHIDAPRMDPGDVLQHVGLDAEAVEGRLEANVDLVGTQPARRVDVGEAGDRYV